MSRENAKAFLISLGIAEPTKEQIDSYMNNFNGEIGKEKDKETKTQALISELTEQIKTLTNEKNELETKGMTESEKMARDIKTLQDTLAERDKQIANAERRSKLSALGITGEQLDKFYSEDGGVDFDNLGSILSGIREKAAIDKENELAGKAGNPGGGTGGADNLTDAEKFVSNMPKPTDVAEGIKSYL